MDTQNIVILITALSAVLLPAITLAAVKIIGAIRGEAQATRKHIDTKAK